MINIGNSATTINKKPDVEDAEDHEIFDINDFTTASDWERFVVQIEELINEWKLNASNTEFNPDQANNNLLNDVLIYFFIVLFFFKFIF